MKRQYKVKSTHAVEEVFGAIKEGKTKFEKASLVNLRIKNFFYHGTKCVACGREGKVFKVERIPGIKHDYGKWHLNLYAEDNVMLTADHIIPASRGGETVLDNLQPMCTYCNASKGNRLPWEPVVQLQEQPEGSKKRTRRRRRYLKQYDWKRIFTLRWWYNAMRYSLREKKLPSFPHVRVNME